jgi:hypothetical protein
MPCSPQLGEAPRRSGRAKKLVAGGYRQYEGDEEDADIPDANVSRDAETTTNPSGKPGTTPGPRINDAQIPGQSQSRKPIIKEERQETVVALSNAGIPAQPLEEEVIMQVDAPAPEIELVVDEEETKPKPLLQLKYQGFNIFGNCLCIVVEPWPPIRAVSRASSIAPIFSNAARASSIAPPNFTPSGQVEATHRERTPLFLPDLDRGMSETPAPFNQHRVLPPVPPFNDPIDQGMDDISNDGLMEFSQALNYAGDHRGGVEDDDEMDGAVFFGDADEAREL